MDLGAGFRDLMSRSGEVTLEFGGEERTFRLAIGQWRKVQEKCDAGPPEILARLAPAFAAARQGLKFEQIVAAGYLGRWRVDDVREVVLQGLLGALDAGGRPLLDAATATRLVRDWVDERPLMEGVAIAYQVVLASVAGTDDEAAAGERKAAGRRARRSHAASTGSGTTATTRSAASSSGSRKT